MSTDAERDLMTSDGRTEIQGTYTGRLMLEAIDQRPDFSDVEDRMPDHSHGAGGDLDGPGS